MGESIKAFYTSKTLWVNLLAIAGLLIQTQTGFIISPEIQVLILAAVNAMLRAITKTSISW